MWLYETLRVFCDKRILTGIYTAGLIWFIKKDHDKNVVIFIWLLTIQHFPFTNILWLPNIF